MEQDRNDDISDEVATPAADDHLGRMFAVPDGWWGFSAVGREDHPGACVYKVPTRSEWILLKGTGAENRSHIHRTEVLIAPSEENGLLKDTVFSLSPQPFRSHRLRNLIPDRLMGELDDADLQTLQAKMIRQFGLPS